uniref:Uncharacterized protein n=1 Tax=Anguilla anguilla TaxID=7936 RepID=A0A0E9VV73_ANGAN
MFQKQTCTNHFIGKSSTYLSPSNYLQGLQPLCF